jgi:polyphosphate kinase 2 (PPK2 family)
MPENRKGEPETLVRRHGREVAAVEQYWHLAERPKPRKPPKDYNYVKELSHLQFELIKVQEWVRLHGLKVVVIFEVRDAAGKHQADHAKPQPAHLPRRRARHADPSFMAIA